MINTNSNVIDMTMHFQKKQWFNKKYDEAWNLYENYAERYAKYGLLEDFNKARSWCDIALNLAKVIEGEKWRYLN